MADPNEQYPRVGADAGGVKVDNGTIVMAIAGAIVGAIAGYFVFYLIANNTGRVLFALPAAAPGLGRVAFTRKKSWFVAGVCLALGLGVSLFIGQNFLVQGLKAMPELGWAAIAAGCIGSVWFGLGRNPR